jgi:antitoxin component of RelBE/YafQ-DinJ toxin-antitoxin module
MARKDTLLSIRVQSALKQELEEIAVREGRTLSQVCELLLRVGAQKYGKEGTKLFRAILQEKKLT